MAGDNAALSAREVARALGLHTNTVKRIPAHLLPYVRVVARGDRRYRAADVREYLRRMTRYDKGDAA